MRADDVLVLDNAANHTGKENSVLEEWLWEYHQINTPFLPDWTPQWNPIELTWNYLEERLKTYEFGDGLGPKAKKKKVCKYPFFHAAADILNKMTHKEIVEIPNNFLSLFYS